MDKLLHRFLGPQRQQFNRVRPQPLFRMTTQFNR